MFVILLAAIGTQIEVRDLESASNVGPVVCHEECYRYRGEHRFPTATEEPHCQCWHERIQDRNFEAWRNTSAPFTPKSRVVELDSEQISTGLARRARISRLPHQSRLLQLQK